MDELFDKLVEWCVENLEVEAVRGERREEKWRRWTVRQSRDGERERG